MYAKPIRFGQRRYSKYDLSSPNHESKRKTVQPRKHVARLENEGIGPSVSPTQAQLATVLFSEPPNRIQSAFDNAPPSSACVCCVPFHTVHSSHETSVKFQSKRGKQSRPIYFERAGGLECTWIQVVTGDFERSDKWWTNRRWFIILLIVLSHFFIRIYNISFLFL